MNENNVEELDKLKTELCDIRQEKLKGNIIRPRTEYIDKGEKKNRYFYGLEKHNYVSKSVHHLEKQDGTILTDQKAILNQ